CGVPEYGFRVRGAGGEPASRGVAGGGDPSVPSGVRARKRRAGEAGDTRVRGRAGGAVLGAGVGGPFAEGDAARDDGGESVRSRGVPTLADIAIGRPGPAGNRLTAESPRFDQAACCRGSRE